MHLKKCPRHWGHNGDKNKHTPCSLEAHLLEEALGQSDNHAHAQTGPAPCCGGKRQDALGAQVKEDRAVQGTGQAALRWDI